MILGIDTLTPQTRVSIGDVGKVFSEGSDQAERVLGEIAQALAEAGKRYDDVTAVCVLTGPGSFTGLRVGLSVAHGIAQSRDIPLYGVTVLEAFSRCLKNDADQLLLLDSRRKELAVARRPAGEADFGPLEEMHNEAISMLLDSGEYQLCGNGWAQLPNETKQIHPVFLEWVDMAAVIRNTQLKDANLSGYRAVDAEPVYLRAPDVTISESKFEHRTLYSA